MCALSVLLRLNIDRHLLKQLTGQRTASKKTCHLDELTHEPTICDMVMLYWSVAILFWQLSVVQYTRCGLAKTRLKHPSLPFDSLPYLPQMKRGWSYSMSMASRAWEPRYNIQITIIGTWTSKRPFLDLLWDDKSTIWKDMLIIFFQIRNHIDTDCQLTVVPCYYAYVGCTEKVCSGWDNTFNLEDCMHYLLNRSEKNSFHYYYYYYYYYYYVKFSTGIFPGEKDPVKSHPETSDFQHLSEDMCRSEECRLLHRSFSF